MVPMLIPTILVDDEPLVTIGLKASINWDRLGCEIVGTARSGTEALRLIKAHQPQIVITDIRMPGLDGIELMKRAEEEGHHACFIVLSVLEDFVSVQQALRAGARDYLVKSQISEDQIAVALRNCIKAGTRSAGGPPEESRTNALISLLSATGQPAEDPVIGKIAKAFPSGRVLIAAIDNVFVRRRCMTSEALASLRIAFVELVRNSFSGMGVEVVPLDDDRTVLIVAGDSANPSIDERMTGAQDKVFEILNLTLSFGASSSVVPVRELRKAYLEADTALNERFFKGRQHIGWYDGTRRQNGRALVQTEASDRESENLEMARRAVLQAIAVWNTKTLHTALASLRNVLLAHPELGADLVRTEYASVLERMIVAALGESAGLQLDHERAMRAITDATDAITIHEELDAFVDQLDDYSNSESRFGPDFQVQKVVEAIHTRFGDTLTLSEIAGDLHVSEGYLRRLFKNRMNATFVEYLTHIRIERAKALLAQGNLRVNEIATRVGYQDVSYFIRVFGRREGLSPERYRDKAATNTEWEDQP